MLAHILDTSGETSTTVLPEDCSRCVDQLKTLVGGELEVVPVPGARYLVFGANAKRGAHEINSIATFMAHEAESIQRDDYLAGTVVLVPQRLLNG